MPKRSLETQIDQLYRGPLESFTPARNALAKGRGTIEARKIRALTKPTLAAWAVNQLYWNERDVYDALIQSVEALRRAHREIVKGRDADLPGLSASHRKAVKKAETAAGQIVRASGHPLTQATLEAISQTLDSLPAEGSPGRLSRALEPRGFEIFGDTEIPPARSERGRSTSRAQAGEDPPRVADRGRSGPSRAGATRPTSRGRGVEPSRDPGDLSSGQKKVSSRPQEPDRRAVRKREEAIARQRRMERIQTRRDSKAAATAVAAANREVRSAQRESLRKRRALEQGRIRQQRLERELENIQAARVSVEREVAGAEKESATAEAALAASRQSAEAARERLIQIRKKRAT